MATARLRDPPKFHVVSAWSAVRYPGPDAEETGLRPIAEPTPRPVAGAPTPAAATEPSALPTAELPEPSQPSTLYNLPALLGRLWSLPGLTPAPAAPVAPASTPSRTPALAGPVPAPRVLAETDAPKWARAWICPACRLTNAPWSRACTECRTAAPSPPP